MTSPDKTEPFAELAEKKRFEKWARSSNGIPMRLMLLEFDLIRYGPPVVYKSDLTQLAWLSWQAALPTPEQYAQAARQIAEEAADGDGEYAISWKRVEQILISILGQPGGKR